MIDAFEIGVALALPEGVAAGIIAVREAMTAVDAAVAAGGAGLVAMVEARAGAASMGAEARVPEAVAATDALEAVAGETVPVREKPGIRAADPLRAVVRGDAGERPPAVSRAGNTNFGRGGAVPARDVAEQARFFARGGVGLGAGDARAALDGAVWSDVPAASDQGGPVSADEGLRLPEQPAWDGWSIGVSRGGGSAPRAASDIREDGEVEQPGASLAGMREAVAPGRQMQADVTRVRAGWGNGPGRAAGSGWEPAEALRAGAPEERGGEAATPMRGATGLFSERAAAPRVETEGGDGGGGGTVVLDGRLVGQWLSDRMARDAARPGAGTTGFDPRQAPAWTPSGVP